MNYLQDQTPFVHSAFGVAITGCRTESPLPHQHIIQWPARERTFSGDRSCEFLAVVDVFTHRCMASISGSRVARCFSNSKTIFRAIEFDHIVVGERAAKV